VQGGLWFLVAWNFNRGRERVPGLLGLITKWKERGWRYVSTAREGEICPPCAGIGLFWLGQVREKGLSCRKGGGGGKKSLFAREKSSGKTFSLGKGEAGSRRDEGEKGKGADFVKPASLSVRKGGVSEKKQNPG